MKCNGFYVILFGVLAIAGIARCDDSNVVWLTLRDHSLNPFTLSLEWRDAVFNECVPSGRRVARIRHGDISLVFWRLLLLGEVQFDDFCLDGIEVSLIRHQDNSVTPLTDPRATNVEIRINMSGSTNGYTRKDASRKNAAKAAKARGVALDENSSPALVIPELLLTNIAVSCVDGVSGARLWSYEGAWFIARNFRTPMLENEGECQMSCGAFLDGTTSSWCSLDVRMRTLAANPTLHLCATAAHVRLEHPWLDKAGMPGQATNKAAASWFDHCYSNACDMLIEGMRRANESFAGTPAVSNFFVANGRSNSAASVWADMGISNRTLMPGMIEVTFERKESSNGALRLRYDITNAPPWVVGHVVR